MKSDQIRSKYLEFFKKRGHTIIPSASLVPENDPTTLFTGSGMQPLLPFFLGEKHPEGQRITDSQKSFRAEDIEEVGDNRHTTFFEMLGNWSLGDYFKEEQLKWFFEFLTDEIGLSPEKLYISVFSGDEEAGVPRDTESAEIWKKLFSEKGIEATEADLSNEENSSHIGMGSNRIFYYDSKKNWWSRAGVPTNMPTGEPGGPDSEVFFDFGTPHDKKYGEQCHPNCDCGRFLEIGNSVFMEYIKNPDGSFDKLKQRNVDFGGGLERITAAKEGNGDIFISVDTLSSIIKKLEEFSGKEYSDENYKKSFRIVADHTRGVVFMIGDGVIPSNTEQGYFARRLIRRSVRHMDILGISENSMGMLAEMVAQNYKEAYPNLAENIEGIKKEIEMEEEKFRKTLESGLKEFTKLSEGGISGKEAFDLYQSYGLPIDMIIDLAEEKDIKIDKEAFDKEYKKHQELSRAGSEQKFKGGLASSGEMETKYHTATHLLNEALRQVLGEAIDQKGSNITSERLRFDFSYGEKMTEEQKNKVETLVNEKIKESLPVSFEEMPLEKAREIGAKGVFGSKYGENVKVYSIGDFSKEICGGPHVQNTNVLGNFEIKKEEAISAGVRRIRAILS